MLSPCECRRKQCQCFTGASGTLNEPIFNVLQALNDLRKILLYESNARTHITHHEHLRAVGIERKFNSDIIEAKWKRALA